MTIHAKAMAAAIGAVLLFLPVLGQAQLSYDKIYKWTDESGVVHFSAEAPPKDANLKVEVFKKLREEPAPAATPAAGKPAAAAADGKAPAKEGDKPAAKKDPEICKRAKDNLAQMQNRRYVVTKDAYGQESIMSEEQVKNEMKRAQDAITANCD